MKLLYYFLLLSLCFVIGCTNNQDKNVSANLDIQLPSTLCITLEEANTKYADRIDESDINLDDIENASYGDYLLAPSRKQQAIEEEIKRVEAEKKRIEEEKRKAEEEKKRQEEERLAKEAEEKRLKEEAQKALEANNPYFNREDRSINCYNDHGFSVVTDEYFKDAVFIGNSRMQGFILYSRVPDLKQLAYVGLSVNSFFTKQVFPVDGNNLTGSEALSHMDFNKVYIKFGLNEVGWNANTFAEQYGKVIEHIQSVNPNAIIFINSVLPISKEAKVADVGRDIATINSFNESLIELAKKYNCVYLDVSSVFTGDDGFMPYEYSFDGEHINVNSVQMWLQYYLSHAVQ